MPGISHPDFAGSGSVLGRRLLAGLLRRRPVLAVQVEISSVCTLSCPFCPVGSGEVPGGLMDPGTHELILDRLPRTVRVLSYAFRGEPTVNPDCARMVAAASARGYATRVTTNGVLAREVAGELAAAGLDRVAVAVDGDTQEAHAAYRCGGSLEASLETVRRLRSARDARPGRGPREIAVQTVVSRVNEGRLDAIARLAREAGADRVIFKSMAPNLGGSWPLGEAAQRAWLPRRPQLRRRTGGRFCPVWGVGVVLHDGSAVLCCSDYRAEHRLGNLLDGPGGAIFSGERFRSLAEDVVARRLPLCRSCPMTGPLRLRRLERRFRW